MSTEEQISLIKEIIDGVRPYLNAEGGDIQFVNFVDGYVYVQVLGACADCGMIDMDISDGIEGLIVEQVPGVIGVKQIWMQ